MYRKILLISTILLGNYFVSAQDIQENEAIQDKSDIEIDSVDGQTEQVNAALINNKVGAVKVRDSIFMLKGKGGNIGLSIGKDGIFMIDDQFAEASESIIARIRTISKKPIELLVNTHHHGDHTGGNSNMAESGALIFSHENARRRMLASYVDPARKSHTDKIDSIVARSQGKISTDQNKKEAYLNAEKIVGPLEDQVIIPDGSLPVVSITSDLTFYYNGEKIVLIPIVNAHTDGDVVVYFTKSNVLHTGDTFFNGSYPFIDIDSRGSVEGYMRGLDRIISIIDENTKIIPGHGDVATLKDVKYTKSMFTFLKNKIAIEVMTKKSEDEVLAMTELTKEYDDKGFGDGFISTEKFIRVLYANESKKYKTKK